MATAITKGTVVSFGNTPQAGNDLFGGVVNEDSTGTVMLDVMSNDLGGNAKSLYSLDNGTSADSGGGVRPTDLLTSDVGGPAETSAMGASIQIVNGKVAYTLTPALKASLQHLAEGATVTDTFTYAIKLGNGTLSWATASVTIAGTNDGPVAQAGVNHGNEDTVTTGAVVGTDVDDGAVLTYSLNGAVDGLTLSPNGSYSFDAGVAAYQHLAEGATTNVVASYTVTDEHGASATSTLTITVTGTNDGPVAVADTNAGVEDTTIAGTVATNDSDVDDGAVLTYSLDAAVAGLTLNADGGYSLDAGNAAYQHLAAGATTDVVANYTVTDEHGATAASTLTITVTGANDGPVAVADTNSAAEDTTITGSVATNDSDIDDGAVLTYLLDGAVAGLTLNADGSYSFDAGNAAYQSLNSGDHLPVVANYTVTDEFGASASSTLTITVNGANDAPPPPPPPTSASVIITGEGHGPSDTHVALPDNATNVTVTVTAAGDFDWQKEGFDITGDIAAHFQGASEHNSTGNHGPETSDFMTFSVPVALTGLADHSVDFQVAFTDEVNPHSSLSIALDWDLAA